MIEKIRWCYCCEEPTKEYNLCNGVYLCNDCTRFIFNSFDCCKNCGVKRDVNIKVSGLSGNLYESKRCLICNQSVLLGEL